jgi:hypothetical protein
MDRLVSQGVLSSLGNLQGHISVGVDMLYPVVLVSIKPGKPGCTLGLTIWACERGHMGEPSREA